MRVTIFTKNDCPSCVKAKSWLETHLIPFDVEDCSDFDVRQRMYDSLGLTGDQRRVPQILVSVDGEGVVEHIRGYEALVVSGLDERNTVDLEEFLNELG